VYTWFRNLKITSKLIVGFLSILSLTGVLGGLAVLMLGRVNTTSTKLESEWLPFTRSLDEISGHLSDFRIAELERILASSPTDRARCEKELHLNLQQIHAGQAACEKLISSPDQRRLFDSFKGAWSRYLAEHTAILALSRRNQDSQAAARVFNSAGDFEAAAAALDHLDEAVGEGADTASRQGDTLYQASRFGIIAALAFLLLLGMAIALFTARLIARPLENTVRLLEEVANGNLAGRLEVTSKDDVGRMGHALNHALDRLSQTIRAIGQNATGLSSAALDLTNLSRSLGVDADRASAQASGVSAAAEQVSASIQTVATGAEEMGASIREIAQNAADAARVAGTAVQVAEATTQTISKLGESSAEIGHVIRVITSIAEQTNLLALNATIEAARAGEAGKGFAVVANEVKELAKETAKATDEIGQKIAAIQTDTSGAVEAIKEISEIIAQINEIQTTIAGAVEEQAVTTNEIGRNVHDAARGAADIADHISGVAEVAHSTSHGAGQSQEAADALARMSVDLQQLVGQFESATDEGYLPALDPPRRWEDSGPGSGGEGTWVPGASLSSSGARRIAGRPLERRETLARG
jgi:methyl-accepting chemotaxis protein